MTMTDSITTGQIDFCLSTRSFLEESSASCGGIRLIPPLLVELNGNFVDPAAPFLLFTRDRRFQRTLVLTEFKIRQEYGQKVWK